MVHPTQPGLELQSERWFESPIPQGRDWRRRVVGQEGRAQELGLVTLVTWVTLSTLEQSEVDGGSIQELRNVRTGREKETVSG
jgi:hypothetical protein